MNGRNGKDPTFACQRGSTASGRVLTDTHAYGEARPATRRPGGDFSSFVSAPAFDVWPRAPTTYIVRLLNQGCHPAVSYTDANLDLNAHRGSTHSQIRIPQNSSSSGSLHVRFMSVSRRQGGRKVEGCRSVSFGQFNRIVQNIHRNNALDEIWLQIAASLSLALIGGLDKYIFRYQNTDSNIVHQ